MDRNYVSMDFIGFLEKNNIKFLSILNATYYTLLPDIFYTTIFIIIVILFLYFKINCKKTAFLLKFNYTKQNFIRKKAVFYI